MRRRVREPFERMPSVVTCLPVTLLMQARERMVSRTLQRGGLLPPVFFTVAWIHSSWRSEVAQLLMPKRLEEASASAKTRPWIGTLVIEPSLP